MANEKKVDRVTTGIVRFSFTKNLLTPNEKGAYGLMILIPKSDTETVKRIKDALEKAKVAPESIAKWGGKWLGSMRNPLRDGDTDRDADSRPEYKGHYFMNLNTYNKPGVVDAKMQPIIDPKEIYSGCYGRVSMTPAAYSTDGNKGLKFYLANVQKLRDGEPLGGGFARPEDDFTAVEDDFLA